ncbi:hypothetical protein Glove_194g33 [Diversispora epigaea]|uniref:Uncharacterized protein n=1 Tax=Diversispora epigaea TaxID=1348612 RepID=A0A397IUU2_9GLOM|nr:hypothetical protein Glove_194g33 [Diversispora epigaea]
MIRSSLNLMVLVITWITIFSLTPSVSSLGNFTHIETNSYETSPTVYQYGKYIDGTVVIRIINRDPYKPTNSTSIEWLRPVLSLRIIHPNGTVSEIDKELEIQEFNWQIFNITGINQSPISIFALQRGYLIVRYFKASDTNNFTTYEEWGRIIDWNGNLYDEVNLGGAYIEAASWYPSVTTIVSNVDPAKGFIRIAGIDPSYVEWQQYMIGDSFNLIKLQEGNIKLPQNGNSLFSIIATVDEGYSMIMANSTHSTNPNNPFEFYAAMYYLKIGYNETQFSAANLLHQLTLPNITLFSMVCDISSSGIGQVCTLITQSDTYYYVKLNFLISGSVIKTIPLTNLIGLPPNITIGWIENIPYGGYLLTGYFKNGSDQTVYGYYLNESANKFINWDFSEPSVLNMKGILIILPNNTLLVSQIESNDTWSFLTTDIPNYSGNPDHGYSNHLVDSTSPPINANISNISNSTDMGSITITYYDRVELSDGNIWIYRIDNSVAQNVTRQFVNGNNNEFCFISADGLTVTVRVIRSTFNFPNSQFYIKVDNNFVKSKVYSEPLMGINDNIWNFDTISIKNESYAGTASGVLRLTIEGTQYYKNLNSTGKSKFFFDLLTELSMIISVDRLSSDYRTQVDNTNRQIFISLTIQSSRSERNVQAIIDDLKDMIKYKDITSISLFPTTNYLDEDFGFELRQNLWVRYRLRFLGVMLAFGILVVLFLLANKKERKGRNIAVLQLGLIIFDFVMDTLFVSNNGKVIEVLYIPSVIFLTVPTVFNIIWASYILFNEKKSESFRNWFAQHGNVVSIFTALSGANIEALSILHSNMAGFGFFNAPFSPEGKSRIFWISCLNIFVEDLPQAIVQILYQRSVIRYDTIPLLALLSSFLNLLINISGRLFQTINLCRHVYNHKRSQNQELQPPDTKNMTKRKLWKEHGARICTGDIKLQIQCFFAFSPLFPIAGGKLNYAHSSLVGLLFQNCPECTLLGSQCLYNCYETEILKLETIDTICRRSKDDVVTEKEQVKKKQRQIEKEKESRPHDNQPHLDLIHDLNQNVQILGDIKQHKNNQP